MFYQSNFLIGHISFYFFNNTPMYSCYILVITLTIIYLLILFIILLTVIHYILLVITVLAMALCYWDLKGTIKNCSARYHIMAVDIICSLRCESAARARIKIYNLFQFCALR
jgi:hypothetical protein